MHTQFHLDHTHFQKLAHTHTHTHNPVNLCDLNRLKLSLSVMVPNELTGINMGRHHLMCIAPLIKTGGAQLCRTSNSFRSWSRNLGRLTSIIDLSNRVSSFSSGKASCGSTHPKRRKWWEDEKIQVKNPHNRNVIRSGWIADLNEDKCHCKITAKR